MMEAKDTRPMIYFNEDNHHFYGAHPPQDMTVEGLNHLVDCYAEGTQVRPTIPDCSRTCSVISAVLRRWRDADSAARAGNRRQLRANGGSHHPEDQRWTETGYRTRRACPGLWPRRVPAGACDNLEVRLNTHPVSACKEPEYDFIEIARFFDLLFDGDNVFEFIPPQVDDRLEWAEVLVLPADRCKQEACLLPNDSDCRDPRQAVFCALGALLRQQRHRAVSLFCRRGGQNACRGGERGLGRTPGVASAASTEPLEQGYCRSNALPRWEATE